LEEKRDGVGGYEVRVLCTRAFTALRLESVHLVCVCPYLPILKISAGPGRPSAPAEEVAKLRPQLKMPDLRSMTETVAWLGL
jgi:hypothetical protein